ncbi:MAG TPA: type II secretion system F family protein [Vicinamibacteria bacterium]|jgi:type IV pilus assembly protein PilC|nr:type II secretion system F family protein [Vicinamibacteria bacterium]
MPAFVWKGKTREGKVVSGERVADNKEAVLALLRRDQILVSSVKEKGKEMALPKLGGGVPAKDLAIFVRQFSVMIDAGLPLVQCLEILGSQQENKNFAKVLQTTRMDVEGGATLADAMRKHPKAFDELFTNMIAAGEAGGILDTILKRLATYIEKAVKLKSQVKGAMVYPVAVLGIAGLVIAVILWKVIPTFASMFEGLGAQLPLPTRIVIAASNWFVRLLPFLVLGAVLLVFFFRRYYATYGGRRTVDRTLLRLPILGTILQKIAVARFCRTLATLISSGVPILDGLEITARTSGNAIIEDAIMAVRKGVESGLTVAQPLKESGVFPPMVVQMIGVGEQTGALDAMLGKIADFYEEEVDQAVANLLTLMEPVMILFLGVTVGGIVISMYLPLFDLISKLS